jgi:alpha-amylase
MSRRPEAYHRKITEASTGHGSAEVKSIHDIVRVKEKDLEKKLSYDWYERRCFLDHFIRAGTTLDEFARSQYLEEGDFVNQPYNVATKKKSRDTFALTLKRDGHLWTPQRAIPISIEKTFTISSKEGIEARYTIQSSVEPVPPTMFAVELNLTLLAGDSEDRFYDIPGCSLEHNRMNSMGELEPVSLVRLIDRWMNIAIVVEYEPSAIFWRFPIETVSQSEGGFERTYQGSSLTALWSLSLDAHDVVGCSVKLRVEQL